MLRFSPCARHTFLSSMAAMLLSITPLAAQAQTDYFIQLGSYPTEQEAKEAWESAAKRFSKPLAPLHYITKKIDASFSQDVSFRAQGGTLTTREDAQKICDEILNTGSECLVVEAVAAVTTKPLEQPQAKNMVTPAQVPTPASPEEKHTTSETSQTHTPTPTSAQESATIIPAPKKETSNWFTRLFSSRDELSEPEITSQATLAEDATTVEIKETIDPTGENAQKPIEVDRNAAVPTPEADIPAAATLEPWHAPATPAPTTALTATSTPTHTPAPNTPRKADVEIAEAINVPLSTASKETKIVPIDTNVMPTQALGLPSEPLQAVSLWAEIGAFSNQQAASDFWQALRVQDNTLPNNLRLRFIQPFQRTYHRDAVSMRVGPFTSTEAARHVCGYVHDDTLHCKIIRDKNLSESMKSTSKQARDAVTSSRGDARAYPTSAGWTLFGTSSSTQNNAVWLQLGTFTDPAQAQQQWDKLKSTHKNLLNGISVQIISPDISSAKTANYRLRAGAFNSTLTAITACEKLRTSDVSCIVAP
jgi:hypothetical protein